MHAIVAAVPTHDPEDYPILVVEELTVAYGGVRAVDALSLAVPARMVVSIIGPNGAGKTTLLNAISGFARPQSGTIRYADVDLTRLPASRRAALGIARTFQDLQLFPRLSLLENVIIGSHSRLSTGLISGMFYWPKAAAEDARARAEAMELLERVNIAQYAKQRVATLPFGIQKMAGIARALALKPRLLLLDEPAAGMSHHEVESFICFIQELRAEHNLTILLVEHNMELVMGLSDRVVVMNHGRQLAAGSPGEIRTNPAVMAAYLGQ
jgi:branched-chain amino acid transport system ATP-binding protein